MAASAILQCYPTALAALDHTADHHDDCCAIVEDAQMTRGAVPRSSSKLASTVRGDSDSTPTVGLNCHLCCACPASHAGARVRIEELAAVWGMCAPLEDASLHAPLCKVSASTPSSSPLLLCRRRRRPPAARRHHHHTVLAHETATRCNLLSQPPSIRKTIQSGSILLTSPAPVPVPTALVRISPSPTPALAQSSTLRCAKRGGRAGERVVPPIPAEHRRDGGQASADQGRARGCSKVA